jgi:hypothetical protein
MVPRMRVVLGFVLLVGCGGGSGFSGTGTPEQAIAGAGEGQHVVITGQVHTVTFDSQQKAARKAQLAAYPNLADLRTIEAVLEQTDEERRGLVHAFDDTGASYPRLTDRYVLLRTAKPDGITQGETSFSPANLRDAWVLGVHLPDLAPGVDMPEVGATIRVTGTFKHVTWNQRELELPIVDDATIEVVDGPPPLAGMGATCSLDQQCSARLICDRTAKQCAPPPREIYWADPFHDVNGACATDADCPLGQVCDPSYTMTTTGTHPVHYFAAADAGKHICRLAPGATVASQCPRIYTTRDLSGGRFVAGKEVCIRAKLLVATVADDQDTHDQMVIDEPIPYPTADAQYHFFGSTTENGPIYKDPALPGGPIADPVEGQEVIAIGTYRYDPDHGWYEVHPVKAYLPPP